MPTDPEFRDCGHLPESFWSNPPIEDHEKLFGIHRSPKWPALEHEYKHEHPNCENCGSKTNVVVHHKIPVHVDATRELDKTNLMSLCENKTMNCHLMIGHAGNWQSYCADAQEFAAAFIARLRARPIIHYPF